MSVRRWVALLIAVTVVILVAVTVARGNQDTETAATPPSTTTSWVDTGPVRRHGSIGRLGQQVQPGAELSDTSVTIYNSGTEPATVTTAKPISATGAAVDDVRLVPETPTLEGDLGIPLAQLKPEFLAVPPLSQRPVVLAPVGKEITGKIQMGHEYRVQFTYHLIGDDGQIFGLRLAYTAAGQPYTLDIPLSIHMCANTFPCDTVPFKGTP
jgi:hypothetical protein